MKAIWILLCGALLLLSGCTTVPVTQFYTLDSEAPALGKTTSMLTLSIGPIDLPEYLDRPQMVLRDGNNRLLFDEFHRWGGALDQEIERVLAGRLAAQLGTQRIYGYPSRIVAESDYRIALDIRAFDGSLDDSVQLDVAWSLIDDRSAVVLEVQRSIYRERVAQAEQAAYAAALGQLIERLGEDLAKAVQAASVDTRKSGN